MPASASNADVAPFAELARCAEGHFVHFYEADDSLARSVAEFLGTGLEAGDAAVLVATEDHRAGVGRHLADRGLDLTALGGEGRWQTLDAVRALPQLMVDGRPDPKRFEELIHPLIERAKVGGRAVRVFGELVGLLVRQGDARGAVGLEALWNDLARRHPISLFCAYPLAAFGRPVAAEAFEQVCATHGRTMPSESWFVLPTTEARDDYVARLQQKASAYDREAARVREVEEVLRGREMELLQFLERTQDGVLDVDMDGTIRWANGAFLAAVGIGPEECLGRPLRDFLAQPSLFSEVWARLAKGQSVRDLLTDLRCGDGETRPVRILTSTLRMAGRALQMRWFTRLPA